MVEESLPHIFRSSNMPPCIWFQPLPKEGGAAVGVPATVANRSPTARISSGLLGRLSIFENRGDTNKSSSQDLVNNSSTSKPAGDQQLVKTPATAAAETSSAKAATSSTSDADAAVQMSPESEWSAVKLRVKKTEEEKRRAVGAARRSLHLDVHVGGGRFTA